MLQPNDLSRSLVALDQNSTIIAVIQRAGWLPACFPGLSVSRARSSSVAVSREHRRAKTDRLDTELLKRGFLGWLRGERGHCTMARVPTIAEEDAKRPNRERDCLVGVRIPGEVARESAMMSPTIPI